MKTAVKIETIGVFPHDKIKLVDVDDVIAYLKDNPPATGTITQLYDFGRLLLDQVRGLRASFDAKLTSCLGWGTATIAVMLAGFSNWSQQGTASTLALVGISAAFLSVLFSVIGFKSFAGWIWPSEKDWFQTEYFSSPDALKTQHIIAMLEAHQSYSRKTQRKGLFLMAAEYLLALSAVLLGAAVLVRQLG